MLPLHLSTPSPMNMSLKKVTARAIFAIALGGSFLFQPICPAATFVKTGSLNTARFGHTATLLPNGKVLVVGGAEDANNGLASAEMYDPATGKWTETGGMNEARCYHTATLLPNGKVLVTGGIKFLGHFLDRALASAELYDPATGKWTDSGALTTERMNHTATLLPNGKVLVAGGSIYDGNICTVSTAELYDATTGKWTETGEMITARAGHPATLLPDGKVLAIGGKNSLATVDSLASTEAYDPATARWTETEAMFFTGRCDHTATLLPNGKVLVAGGWYGAGHNTFLAELYDPTAGKWEHAGALNSPRSSHTATVLPDGKVLIVGGAPSRKDRVSGAELYDSAGGKWIATAAMSVERMNHTATLLPDGRVLIAGGFLGRTYYSTTELYVPANEMPAKKP